MASYFLNRKKTILPISIFQQNGSLKKKKTCEGKQIQKEENSRNIA